MNKPIFKDSFSVEDIHKLREYNYEKRKKMSKKEIIDEINEGANIFEENIKKLKKKDIAI